MTTKQKLEISGYLKGILRCLKTNSTNPAGYNISKPLFIFETETQETRLIQLIANLETEIHEEENKLLFSKSSS